MPGLFDAMLGATETGEPGLLDISTWELVLLLFGLLLTIVMLIFLVFVFVRASRDSDES